MSAELTTTTAALPDLAAAIRVEAEAVELGLRATVESAVRCGELLLEAKAQIPHGSWLPWLAENVGMPARTAQWYMAAAKNAGPAHLPGATIAQLAAGGRVEEPQATNLFGEPDPRMQEDDGWRARLRAEQSIAEPEEVDAEPVPDDAPEPEPATPEPDAQPSSRPETAAGEVVDDPLGEARKRYSSAASRAFRDNDAGAARQALAVWRQEVRPALERVAREGVQIDRSRWRR